MTDTRAILIQSAILIFNEDLSSPLEKVAENANINRRTLHRYFKDRKELMHSCETEVQKACFDALTAAYNSSEDPLTRLEHMFFAGLDCGVKHAFLHKLHNGQNHDHNRNNQRCSEYDRIFSLWEKVLDSLRAKELISEFVTIQWVQNLFNGIMTATIQSTDSGSMSTSEIQKHAWYSFSKGIGL